MFGLHPIDLIIILVIALLVFGPKRLPEMGASIGKSIKEFRKGMNELGEPKEVKEDPKKQDLDALDREVASKHASYDFQPQAVPVAPVESEVVSTVKHEPQVD
jgi:sec-independent protein translocase protein TatA